MVFFFFKQKTAYEMRISDWSSDVCSSDLSCLSHLNHLRSRERRWVQWTGEAAFERSRNGTWQYGRTSGWRCDRRSGCKDRKSVVSGKSVSVRVDLGGRRSIKKKKKHL